MFPTGIIKWLFMNGNDVPCEYFETPKRTPVNWVIQESKEASCKKVLNI